jgi:erythromycin esterase-like protein
MTLNTFRCVAICSILFGSSGGAQDSTFIRALKASASEFNVVGGKIAGPAAASLMKEARENQFLLVGEDHGIREVPGFVGALFDLVRAAGYSHLAVEVGPVTARRLESMMRSPAAQSDLDSLLGANTPYTIPFFFWKEEAQMLERAVKSLPGKNAVVWGLDQEFMMSPTYLLQQLSQLATSGSARSVVDRFAASSAQADKTMMSTGNPSGLWMLATTDADIAQLREAFGHNAPAAADEIIDELAESRDIYRKFGAGAGYESNQQRDDMMKRHFVDWYRSAQAKGEAHPKVVVKLGANHIFRGPSTTDTYEIGSFVPEFAQSQGGRAFNILLVVKRGTYNAYRPFGSKEADKTKNYDLMTSDEYKVFDMPSVAAATSDTSWTLIDLRPARKMIANGSLKRISPTARRLLLSFDAVVAAPEGHASTYFR